MESRVRLAGHPVHPMLVVFPLGLLATSLVFDLLSRGMDSIGLATASFYMIPAGIIAGLLAAVPGLIDWLAIPTNTRARAIGLWHAIGNVIMLACFTAGWFLRREAELVIPSNGPIILSVLGVLLAVVAGWLGGELVTRLGIGVASGAHLNSPNSMGKRPATDADENYLVMAEPGSPAPYAAPPGRGAMGRATEPSGRRTELGATRPAKFDGHRGEARP